MLKDNLLGMIAKRVDLAIPRTRLRKANEALFKRLISNRKDLFEKGLPEDALDAASFARRVNRQVFVQSILHPAGRQHNLSAIDATGKLRLPGELIVFGRWLLSGGKPGPRKRPGPAPDYTRLLQVAACALAALAVLEDARREVGIQLAQDRGITGRDIARVERRCFDRGQASTDYSANLRSLRRIIPEYIAQVKDGSISFEGQTVKAAPMLARLAKAIDPARRRRSARVAPVRPTQALSSVSAGRGSRAATRPLGGAATGSGAGLSAQSIPSTFEIPLMYSSPDKQAEYQGGIPGRSAPPILRYRTGPVKASRAHAKVRGDLAGRIVLEPEEDILGKMTTKAVIDKIAFIVKTRSKVSDQMLRSSVTRSGASVHIRERTKIGLAKDHHASLPEVPLSEPTGYHFALTVFDAIPSTLQDVVDGVERCAGIDGEILLFHLELAVDFFARKSLEPAHALTTREKLVGLLQRHVWAAPSAFDVPDGSFPRYIDARQFYMDKELSRTRYLFSGPRGRQSSDREIKEEGVRQVLLDPKTGNDLYLDATIYRGDMNGQKRTNVQHKIADERNKTKGKFRQLSDKARRARMEVTLTSLGALEAAGLRTLKDLHGYKFRNLVKNHLVFRLPTCGATVKEVEQTIEQMKTRGIYGVELSQRAKYLEDRMRTKPRPRNRNREGRWLVDWPEMNAKVGHALDQLRKQWLEF